MKQKLIYLPLILFLFFTNSCRDQEYAEGISTINVDEAHQLIEANRENPDFIILDVRTPGEVAEGIIESATNINYNSDDFREQVNLLDKEKTYLVYCKAGSRSSAAQSVMIELGFKKIYNMDGGYTDWVSAGYSTVIP